MKSLRHTTHETISSAFTNDSCITTPTRLLNKNFVLLWQGQFVSSLGSQAFAIAMMFWIKHETGSATLMGTLMMASTIPSVLLGPIAGTFADHHSRKWIIVWCDILNGILATSFAVMVFIAPDRVDFLIVWLFIISVLATIVSSFFRPAISAAIPDLVPPNKLASANSINQFSMQLSGFLGQGAGGVLYRLLGAPVLFLFDGLSYIFSAISEMFITIPQTIPEKTRGLKASWERFKTNTAAGFAFVWKNAGLRALFGVAAFLNFLLTPVMVLLPFFVEDFLHATTDWFGYMMAGFGAGAMAGYVAAGAFRLSGRRRMRVVIVALVVTSLLFGAIGFMTGPISALVLFVLLGVTNGMVNINIATVIQLTTPSEIRGRVMGLLGTLVGGLAPIAMGLSGVVADLVNQNIPLIIIVCGASATVLSIGLAFSRPYREFLSYVPPKPPETGSPSTESPENP